MFLHLREFDEDRGGDHGVDVDDTDGAAFDADVEVAPAESAVEVGADGVVDRTDEAFDGGDDDLCSEVGAR
jgi:hypothetical protein